MIELRHLRYFRAVAEEQNFHRAAERIPVDLSALSRAVRELEDYVGVELLVRSPAGTRITPAGARMLDGVRGIFDAIEQATRAAREVDGRERLPLRIGIADGLIQPMLTQCLALWREGAQCELQLDDRALFFPTDAALASWMAQAHEQRAEIVFD